MAKENNNFMLIVGLVLALFLLVGQSYMLTNNDSENNLISVSGNSELSVTPDVAYVYVSVNTLDENPKLAQSENVVLSVKVIDALKNLGISEDDIETDGFRLNEKYEYVPFGEEKSDSIEYEVVHSLKVKTLDLDSIGTLVDTVISAGANGVSNIDYTLSDDLEKQVRADALEKAIIAGSEKAVSMAKTLNIGLGDVVKVTENNYYYNPYTFAANVKAEAYDVGGAGNLNFLSPQNVKVKSSVGIEFELE